MTYISGFHRPFSLTDDALSYPNKTDIVSLPVVAIVSIAGPAAVIVLLNLLTYFSSSRRNDRSLSLRDSLRIIAWETHAGWLGLCAGLAVTLFVTAGLKDMVGKPRPDLLARCQPDLTNIDKYIVGGFGVTLDSEAPPFVSYAICQQKDRHFLDDGFAAFPSGHSSFSSAGMVYLSLWLCARWSIAIPFLDRRPARHSRSAAEISSTRSAPPLWQVATALGPIFVALFICSSRYADFHHAGFDIIAGAVIGTIFGYASFRLYHLPVRRSAGALTWGPRSTKHALVAHPSEEELVDEEYGNRAAVGTELDFLSSKAPPRIGTNDTHRPILGSSDEIHRA